MAKTLVALNKRLTTPDQKLLGIRYRPEYPKQFFGNGLKEKITQVLGKRYVSQANALDLTRFHNDPGKADYS